MDDYKNEELRKQIVEKGREWVAQGEFWLFGTATYYDGTAISEDAANKDARYFFNMLDRKIIKREDYRNGIRLKRMAFIETGRTRTNTHIHFFIKGIVEDDYEKIWCLSVQLWAKKIMRGYNLVMKDNLGAEDGRDGYGWKELDNLNKNTLLVECCNFDFK